MAFRDPFAAYNAGSNVEAHVVCGLLQDAGVESLVVEDVSAVGWGWAGPLAEVHKPQVWIERDDIERARPVLTDYERRNAVRRAAERGGGEAAPPVEVTCEECGRRSEFPAAQTGTVQSCPHCRAYVDVGVGVELEGWDEAPGEDEG